MQASKPKETEIVVDIDFNAYLSETTAMNIRLNAEVEKLKQSISDFAGLSESACRSTLIKKSGSSQTFSQENKAKDIELTPNQLEAKKTMHNLPKILVCENPLRNGLNRISFRVKSLAHSIALGIGLLSKIKERGFSFDGKYMLLRRISVGSRNLCIS